MLLAFGLATIVQLLFWGFLFSRLVSGKRAPVYSESLPPVSVVICARNEGPHLAGRLPAVLNQDYPNFEVIVVDHASTDDTATVLNDLAARFPALRIIPCQNERPGKRLPLKMGIAEARHPWVVLTDADCLPASSAWLRLLAEKMGPGTEVILGYGPLEKKTGLLNAFARFETAMTAIQYFSYALAGIPYMGVGRNLAYLRSSVLRANAEAPSGLISGDDDLTVNALANARNTAIQFHPDSFTWSAAPESWKAFFRQKSRHLTTGRRYKPLHQALLAAWALSFLGHYLFGILAIATGSWVPVLEGYAIRQLILFLLFLPLGRALAIRDLHPKLPFLDLLLFFYYLLMTPAIWRSPGKKWK